MKQLFISFSGGRTSAYMTKRLLDEAPPGQEIIVAFANTGEEHEETLRFVDRCNREFGFGVIWLEAVVHAERGKGTTHRIVDFSSASRRGEPFTAACSKFGIPNSHYPHCTRELKERPMSSFIRSLGWRRGEYDKAIGIRADEIDRMNSNADHEGIVYPLVKWGVTKADVLAWWRRQPFDLYLPEHLGNCKGCWKKSFRKLLTIATDEPEVFAFHRRMEEHYSFTGPGEHDGPRRFFRGNKSVADIVAMSRQPFDRFEDAHHVFDPELDVGSGCGESCEVWADEGIFA